jgi:hypothetical protein
MIFYDMTPYNLVDGTNSSDESAASIIEGKVVSSETLAPIWKITFCIISEDRNLYVITSMELSPSWEGIVSLKMTRSESKKTVSTLVYPNFQS